MGLFHGLHCHTMWLLPPGFQTSQSFHVKLWSGSSVFFLLPHILLFSLLRNSVFIQRSRTLTTLLWGCPKCWSPKRNVHISCLDMPATPTEVGLLCKGWLCKQEHEIETMTTSRLGLEDCVMFCWLVSEPRLKKKIRVYKTADKIAIIWWNNFFENNKLYHRFCVLGVKVRNVRSKYDFQKR